MLLTIILVLIGFLAFDHWTQLTGASAALVAASQKFKDMFAKTPPPAPPAPPQA